VIFRTHNVVIPEHVTSTGVVYTAATPPSTRYHIVALVVLVVILNTAADGMRDALNVNVMLGAATVTITR